METRSFQTEKNGMCRILSIAYSTRIPLIPKSSRNRPKTIVLYPLKRLQIFCHCFASSILSTSLNEWDALTNHSTYVRGIITEEKTHKGLTDEVFTHSHLNFLGLLIITFKWRDYVTNGFYSHRPTLLPVLVETSWLIKTLFLVNPPKLVVKVV